MVMHAWPWTMQRGFDSFLPCSGAVVVDLASVRLGGMGGNPSTWLVQPGSSPGRAYEQRRDLWNIL